MNYVRKVTFLAGLFVTGIVVSFIMTIVTAVQAHRAQAMPQPSAIATPALPR